MIRLMAVILSALAVNAAHAETSRKVYLEDQSGARIEIAQLGVAEDGGYTLSMNAAPFTDHFLSMRPFKCLEGPGKHWCHVPYPYALDRNISSALTDLEYDLLFVWKGSAEYGIDMWNGLYYRLDEQDGNLVGTVHEMDMDLLSAPPDADQRHPLRAQDIVETDPDSHWLPKLVIE